VRRGPDLSERGDEPLAIERLEHVVHRVDLERPNYGVTGVQARRRGELIEQGAPDLGPGDSVPFTPACGLRELRATASLGYALTQRLSIIGTGGATRLERGAAASPLTRKRTMWEAGLGLSWRL
jgi:hypothetical protein